MARVCSARCLVAGPRPVLQPVLVEPSPFPLSRHDACHSLPSAQCCLRRGSVRVGNLSDDLLPDTLPSPHTICVEPRAHFALGTESLEGGGDARSGKIPTALYCSGAE